MPNVRSELMKTLAELQAKHPYQDILTITAFMNEEELAAHVERYRRIHA